MAEEMNEQITPAPQPEVNPKAAKAASALERKRNVIAVFGSGLGKIAIVSAGIVTLIFVAVGVRTLSAEPEKLAESQAQVDAPSVDDRAPQKDTAVTEAEAIRMAEAAAREAAEAAQKGESYVPGFNTNIAVEPVPKTETASFKNEPPAPAANPAQDQAAAQAAQQQQAAREAAAQKTADELKGAAVERDKYIENVREQVLRQIESVAGAAKTGIGTYQRVDYPRAAAALDTGATGSNSSSSTGENAKPKMLIFKTGSTLFATLDSEVNTDDGSDVFATVRGGPWDGSKLLGKIEQTPNNIRAVFTTLAPQDGRPTMSISAIALRAADAKQGIAEKINHHTISRYGSLGVASLLSGYGKAFEQTPGTTIVNPAGTTVQTVEEPSNRLIYGRAAGELGTALAGEIKKGFNRPATYSTPADTGFAIFFLTDVFSDNQR